MDGYIKLHRCITENEFYCSERFTKTQAWIDLLILATYKERTVFIRGIEIKLAPGDLCYSLKSLAERWQWNKRTVKSFLEIMQNREQISFRSNKVTTIISICNWERYQQAENATICDDVRKMKTRKSAPQISLENEQKTQEIGHILKCSAPQSAPQNAHKQEGKEYIYAQTFLFQDEEVATEQNSSPKDLFSEFWRQYPKKRDKAKAERMWKKIKVDPPLFNKIIEAIREQSASEDWQKNGGQFIPYPSTWLNGARWEDEPLKQCKAATAREFNFVNLNNYGVNQR